MADVEMPSQVDELARRLAQPRPMRRGSVSQRMVKCNRAGCACQERAQSRHGPYVSWVRVVDGKTRSRWVSAAQAELLEQQVKAGQEFRKQVESYWKACEQWADAELEAVSEPEAAKKGGSKRRSKPRSSPRSKRS